MSKEPRGAVKEYNPPEDRAGMETCRSCTAPLDPEAVFCPQCGASRAAGSEGDPLLGLQIIGQYVIRERLGQGGMGVVYLADQPSVGRQAVVKVMHPELCRDPHVAARFQVEARAASQLNHPHIITVYNYGVVGEERLFLAMEHCAGRSLEQALAQEAFSEQRAARIGVQIADALAEAHRHGVIHRDLKPSNIMLGEVGRHADFVKVLDFGIAKMEGVQMTRTGTMVGTPQYMSPEQLRGDPIDGRSDLYSLGILLYQLVTGRPPFISDTIAGYMHKHLNESPLPPARVVTAGRVSPEMERIILRALEKRVTRRFADADEMGTALEALVSPEEAAAGGRVRAGAGRLAPMRRGLLLGLGGGIVLACAAVVVTALHLAGTGPSPTVAPGPERRVAWRSAAGARSPGGQGSPAGGLKEAASGPLSASRMDAYLPLVDGGGAGRRTRAVRAAAGLDRQRVVSLAHPLPAVPGRTDGVAPQHKGEQVKTDETPEELEARLRTVIRTSRMPPSTLQQTMEGYQRAMVSWPANRRQQMRRKYLVQLIQAFSKPSLQLDPLERRPLARLKEIFLSMPTRAELSIEQRRTIMESILTSQDQGRHPAADRQFYKRMALINLIKHYAADPRTVLSSP